MNGRIPGKHKMLRLTSILFIVLLLAACGSKLNEDNFDQIENGMAKEKVFEILGKPAETSSMQMGGLSGTSAVWEDDSVRITVQFLNGKVKLKQFTRSENSPVE